MKAPFFKRLNGSGILLLSFAVAFACTTQTGAQTCLVIPASGPFVGGSSVLLTNASPKIGNGSDITNVTVGGVAATLTGQGTNWVAFVSPVTVGAGVKDIVIQSTSHGNTTLTNAYTYNPAGQIGDMLEDWTQWQEVAGLPTACDELAVAVLNDALYAVGGWYGDPKTNVYRYNGMDWTEAAGLPAPRCGLAAGVLNDALYAVGGWYGDPKTNVYRYDGTNWTEVAGLPTPRAYMAAAVLNGALYAVGGDEGWPYARTNVYRYNGTNWTEVAGLPAPRYALAAGVLNDALYAVGGCVDDEWGNEVPQANVYRYIGTSWTEVAGLPAVAGYLAAGVLNGALYTVDRYDGSGQHTNVYRYDGTNWTEAAGLPAALSALAAETLNGALYAVGGWNGSYVVTNMYRYPRPAIGPGGVIPSSGSYTGGFPVVIRGVNLGNGADITNVTLCGVSAASILSQSATQVTIMAGVSSPGLPGDVAVYSASYGTTVKRNAFTYGTPGIAVLGMNGAAVTNGETVSGAKGTDFGYRRVGVSLTHTLSITNTGAATLTIRGWTTNGTGASAFAFSGIPSAVPASSAVQFGVVFAPSAAGAFNASLAIASDATGATNYTVNLRGSGATLSMAAGPLAGGNTITITNGTLGNGADITNVLVGGLAATIMGQGTNWVTILVPASASAGVQDIVIRSASVGDTSLVGIYTVNPAGQIGGAVEDWTRWQEVAGLPAPRASVAAGVANSALYAVGGEDWYGERTNVYRYSGTLWADVAGLPAPRSALAAGVLNGALYAVGGTDFYAQTNVYRCDGTNWTDVAGLPAPRCGLAVGVWNGSLYAVGGAEDGGYAQANVYRYNGTNWTDVAGLPAARRGLAAGVWNGSLYAVGGADDAGYAKTNVYRYNGTNWTEVAGLPAGRAYLGAGVLNGALYAVGGRDSNWNPQATVYCYNGTNWTTGAALPAAREHVAAGVLNGMLCALGGDDGSDPQTNVYAYPYVSFYLGVSPSNGSCAGGYPVVITGTNFGNGADITNVTLCGVSVAGILSQSATQVTVMAGASASELTGDVAVYSPSYGVTVKSNAFTYATPGIAVLGTHGTAVASGASASPGNGTDFGHVLVGVVLTNTFSIANTGTATLVIGAWRTNGAGALAFAISGIPAAVSVSSSVQFRVVFTPPAAGTFDASLWIASDAPGATNYTVNLCGSAAALSATAGPLAGGNTITIANGALGGGADITNVLVGGVAATIAGQGTNWVTIVVPASASAGVQDIVIQSTAIGDTTLVGAYTVNSAGQIGVCADWTRWQEVAGLPAGRQDLAAGVLNGALYAVGGYRSGGVATNVYRYNGTNWTDVAGLPAPCGALAAGVLNGALYAVGGWGGSGCQTNVYRYDGTNWTEMAGLPAPRGALAAGVLNGALYAVGGFSSDGVATNAYRYDEPNWTEVTGMPAARYTLAAGALNGSLYALGGAVDAFTQSTNVYRYNGTHWTEAAGLPAGRSSLAAGVLNGALYAIGGVGDYAYGTNVYRYDGTHWTEAAGLPAGRSSLAAGVWNGALYVVGGYCGSDPVTNVYRYPRTYGTDPGVSPTNGSGAGGYPVTISGGDLGNGADITNVTLCGVPAASVLNQSATQVTVVAGTSVPGWLGDVVVYSTSYGTTVKSNVFTYTGSGITVLGTNGAGIANGAGVSAANGTDFGHVLVGVSLTNTLTITNTGNATLAVSGWTTNGAAAAAFTISGIPSGVSVSSGVQFRVVFSPSWPGALDASLSIATDAPGATNYIVNLRGAAAALSTTTGPLAGGNTITITNGALGGGADITNVLVGGVAATITGQGASWVTIAVPASGSAGLKDIVIQSASVGDTVLVGAYTVNPAGQIGGSIAEDWTKWQEVAGLPAGRYGVAAGVLNGALYALGGSSGSGTVQTNVYRYNGTNWTEVAGLPAARNIMAAGVLDGALVAVGGNSSGAKTNVYRYDGTNWTEVAGLPAGRAYMGAAVMNGALYAVGGYLGTSTQTNMYRYNGTNWTQVSGLPAGRYGLAAGVLNEALVAVGGRNDVSMQTNVYRYNGTNWMEVAGLPDVRAYLGAGVLNGALYAIGGDEGYRPHTNVYRYNGTNWTEVAGLPAARYGLAAGVLNGALYAVGGWDNNFVSQTNMYRYPRMGLASGVHPSSGSCTGGCAVTIAGTNLGNGTDVTNVTLCGVSAASIVSQSATQVVVMSAAGSPGLGDVAVCSASYGTAIGSNAFLYNPAIAVVSGPHGVVAPSGVVDVAYGGSTSFVVTADAYYHIGSLATNGASVAAATNRPAYTSDWVNVTAMGVLTAAFAEDRTTNTGTPHWWLAQHGWTNSFEAAATNDADGDGMGTWAEYLAGTQPTNRASLLRFSGIAPAWDGTGIVLRWQSADARCYRIERGTNWGDAPVFGVLVKTNIPGVAPVNTETDTTAVGKGPWFYRIKVE